MKIDLIIWFLYKYVFFKQTNRIIFPKNGNKKVDNIFLRF